MDPTYQQKIEELFSQMPTDIVDTSQPRRRGRAPTQAFSEFLTNREQGDWAEELVQTSINESLSQLKAVKYGKSDDIVAGDPNFKEFYETYQDELDTIGKKPDLLVFDKNAHRDEWGVNLTSKTEDEVNSITKTAKAGLEVRSSAFLVSKYEDYIQNSDERTRNFLSFTPKAEDLLVIYRWISNFGVKHFYVQVFFDRIYMISFERILEIVSDPANRNSLYTLEKNAKNQFKSTIHIDVNQGVLLAENTTLPQHESEVKELPRGRLLYYVKFSNGEARFNSEKFLCELER